MDCSGDLNQPRRRRPHPAAHTFSRFAREPYPAAVTGETTGAGSATAVGTGVRARGAREDKVCEPGGLGRERESRGVRQPARQSRGAGWCAQEGTYLR